MNRRDFYYKLQSLCADLESVEMLGEQNEFLSIEDQEWVSQVRSELDELAALYELR